MNFTVLPNKFKSRKEWGVYVWDELMHRLAKARSPREMKQMFEALITDHEKQQIIHRASAISLLKQGTSYRDIGSALWLSPVTISAIRKSMRAHAGYVSTYARNKKGEKKYKRLTRKEWDQLQFSLQLQALFTLPPPPIRHPKLMKQLGYRARFSRMQKRA
jgi:uncharacterized protein YerC